MNGKAPILLGLAVLCGIGAMFGVKSLLSRKPSTDVPMSEVLVAAREIRVEEMLTEEMVTTKEMPKELVPPGSFTEFKALRGRWALIRMLPGDVILEPKLAVKGTPTGMIARITPGMRAFTVRVDEQSGVSGFILPDYRVDVLQATEDATSRARLVLQNVRVLASGTVIESPEDRSIESKTVTLEVTPEQVRTLTGAIPRGLLTLSLRGLDDDVIAEIEPIEPPAAEPLVAEAPEPPPVFEISEPGDDEPDDAPPRRLTVFSNRGFRHALVVGAPSEPEAASDDFRAPDESLRRPYFLDYAGPVPSGDTEDGTVSPDQSPR